MKWLVMVAGLVGCAAGPNGDAPNGGAPEPASCGAATLQSLVGQPAAVLETMRFGQPVRIVRPGTAVTMDYSEGRLNIEIDAAERITRVTCG